MSIQPKAASKDPLLTVSTPTSNESDEGTIIKAGSSSLMEESVELDLDDPQVGFKLDKGHLELQVITSGVNEEKETMLKAISPDSASSIEVLCVRSDRAKDSFNSSTSTLTNAPCEGDEGFPGVREPGEGQENTSEVANDQEAESNGGESSSSKSYELIKMENASLCSKKVYSSSGDECATSSDIEIISNSLCSEVGSGKVSGPSPTSPLASKNRNNPKAKGISFFTSQRNIIRK